MKWIGKGLWAFAGLMAVLAFGVVRAQAQGAQLQMSSLDKLASKATETVEVTLDKRLLQVAAKFLSDKNPTEAKVKQLVSGLDSVSVRVFDFEKTGEYSSNDVTPIRSQLVGNGWQKIVGVRSRHQNENVDVHIKYQGDAVQGITIIATDPRQLVIVNIVGAVDLEKLRELEGQFGIPKLDLEQTGKPKTRNE